MPVGLGSGEEKIWGLRRQYEYEVAMQFAEAVRAPMVLFSPDLVG